jgi:exonuclease SbcC
MQIIQIDLENAKSYRRQSVTFTEGTNAICGPNGAGKSTLLEAIGFALFDSLPYAHNQFVREGEKTATVTVHLVGEDGRAYQVVRKCGSGSQYYVYDPEIGHKLTTNKSETMDWLHEFLGVEETGNLPALFEDAVGVPQGLLTAAFLERPGNRKNTFDPLLRVDEYKRVWDALLGPRRHLEKQIAEEEKRIAGFEAEVKVLPSLQGKVAVLRTEVEEGEQRQAALQAELSDVAQRKGALEATKKRLDELEQAVTQATGVVHTLAARLADAEAAEERAQAAQAIVGETQAGHQAYQAAQANLEGLEEQRQERDCLKETLQGLVTELALARQRIEGLKAELKAIEAAEAEMEMLRPQVGAQERLEAELAESRRAADRLADAERNLEQEQKRLADLEARLSDVRESLDELAKIEKKVEALQEELEALEEERDALKSQTAAYKAELKQIREQTAALEAAETAECPVCEGPLTPEHRTQLLARNEARRREVETSLHEALARQEETEKTRQQKQKTQRKLEKQAKKLPRPAEADEILTQIVDQRQALTETESTVAELAAAPAEVERLTAELEALGDPRRHYQRVADVAVKRSAVEEGLTATGDQIGDLEGRTDALQEVLRAYADLDECIAAEQAAMTAYEGDHQRYLEHIREAEVLAERQEQVADLSDELDTARADCDRLTQERDQVAAEYDADGYAELVENHSLLSSELAALTERLRLLQDQVNEGQAEIERLTGVRSELEASCAEHAELVEVNHLLGHLRGVLRDAGPKVTKALVEAISLQAARLYADVMADHTARLQWTEDYEILLTTGGRERTFQQLSGGEQMAAALAVRLALLREVSDIDIAFFDEPTANLDDQRRDNLAEQILNVKGRFSQLFVISHDDTFERDTDHVVRVVKQNGVSRVEV